MDECGASCARRRAAPHHDGKHEQQRGRLERRVSFGAMLSEFPAHNRPSFYNGAEAAGQLAGLSAFETLPAPYAALHQLGISPPSQFRAMTSQNGHSVGAWTIGCCPLGEPFGVARFVAQGRAGRAHEAACVCGGRDVHRYATRACVFARRVTKSWWPVFSICAQSYFWE